MAAMGNRPLVAAIIVFLVILSLSVAPQIVQVKAQAKTILVPTDYPTIQQAINTAADCDTIFVKNGIYNETIEIHKTIILLGEERNSTIINAQKAKTPVLLVQGEIIV
jgi:pectin methylesterase-like acyl-CoA thioesterase